MKVVRSGDRAAHKFSMFPVPLRVCKNCFCIFMASDEDFVFRQDQSVVQVDCPQCGYGFRLVVSDVEEGE